jgi:hypothetical protein
MRAEAARVEQEATAVRAEQKRLVAAITDKGGSPEGVSPEMVRSLLTLSDGA